MPKGIRKACANCIKARLACDEGRPCQRCVVHQCECVAVPRKPRVKKQKLDLEPPTVVDTKPTNIPTIDSSVEVVVPNWVQNDFVQNNYGSFQSSEETVAYDIFNNSPTIMSPSLVSRLSPPALDSPPLMMAGTPQLNTPSPPQSPPNSWVQRQLQAALLQQYVAQPAPVSTPVQPAVLPQPTPVQQPTQIPQLTPSLQSLLPQQQLALLAHFQRQQQAQLYRPYDAQQMMSLLMDEKPSPTLSDWQDTTNNNFTGQLNFTNPVSAVPFKSSTPKHAHMTPLPQAKNSTPLFPAPIAVFDKQRFQLLDANEAMANFVGHNSVASLSTEVVTMDDLVNPEAAHIAKNAYHNFVANSSPCFRIGDIRTRGGVSKTVEFHVDLTEQLLIFTVKSVLDTCPGALPDSIPSFIKKDISQQCKCKACEYLSPID